MINIKELPSGVRLITEPMEGIRSVCIGIWCNTGSINERPEEYGISHFIEHMLFKGTENRTPFEIVDDMDVLGADINAFTGKETTCYYVKCLDEHLLSACDVLVDMIENPLFDEQEMEREKLVVIEEINMNGDDPDDVALDALENVVFAGSGLEHPVLGFKETVNAFSQDMVRNYYDEHYTRDAITVSVAGSFDNETLEAYLNDKFMKLGSKQREDSKPVYCVSPDNQTIYKDIEQAHICMGIPTVSCTHPFRYKLSMLSTILGGGMSSRLFQHVREQKGLAYSVYSMNGFYTTAGTFVIAAGVAIDRVDETLEAVKEELNKLRDEPVTEHEFISAKNQLKANYIYSQENVKSRMSANGRNYFALGKCPSQDEVLEMLDAITIEELEEAKMIIADADNYSIVNVTGRGNEA